MKIRTLIVDDEPLARQLIRSLLSQENDIEIIKECADGLEALAAINKYKPQLIFLDVQMPGLSGYDVLEKIDPGGVALGMFDMGLPFDGETMKLDSGDRLFLFTDGIPEAMDPKENEYSDERLEKFFIKNKTKTAESFITKVFDDVKKFTKSAPQSDDITGLYLIKY